MGKNSNLPSSREAEVILSEEKKRKTAKPLRDLCAVYNWSYNQAFSDCLGNRLKLFQEKGELLCKTKDFRAYLEEMWNAGLYKETKLCTDCGKIQPLFFFTYHGNKEAGLCYHCRECHCLYKERLKGKKRLPYGDNGDEESAQEDCRVYKSTNDFLGKLLTIETKSEGNIIDFQSLTIESILMDDDGRSAMLAGKDKDGKTRIQKLLIAEIQSLCYEGLSIYWSEKSERLYKKVIISNN